eukprot:357606-Chlamydomonas_euryale.AAC.9
MPVTDRSVLGSCCIGGRAHACIHHCCCMNLKIVHVLLVNICGPWLFCSPLAAARALGCCTWVVAVARALVARGSWLLHALLVVAHGSWLLRAL